MENISQPEIDAVEGFVAYAMIRDAANVMNAHRAVYEGLLTRKVTCSCGVKSRDAMAWRRHVAHIILSRHTALMARKSKEESWSKEVMPV